MSGLVPRAGLLILNAGRGTIDTRIEARRIEFVTALSAIAGIH